MQNEKNENILQTDLKIRIFEILERQGLITAEEKNRLKILISREYGK